VRQLQNVIARSTVVCTSEMISLRDLPEAFVKELQAHAADVQAAVVKAAADEPRLPSTPPIAVLEKLRSGTAGRRLAYALDLAFPDSDVLPTVAELEAAGIRLAMRRLANNLQMTARRLQISRATLYRRIDSVGRDPSLDGDETN
jgi:DNA-binding NtrC family response regulator